jgi:hypothetical protein
VHIKNNNPVPQRSKPIAVWAESRLIAALQTLVISAQAKRNLLVV